MNPLPTAGIETLWIVVGAGLFGFGILLGALITWWRMAIPLNASRLSAARAEAERDYALRRQDDLEDAFDTARSQLHESFQALASQALRANSGQFLRLAQGALDQSLVRGEHRLSDREKAVEGLVAPIRELLARSEAELRDIEQARTRSFATLEERMTRLSEDHRQLAKETTALTRALSKPGVRGRWGELTLKRAVELAGMSAHCDFTEQADLRDEHGRALRPDLLVHLPGDRAVVVDAKTPLDGYLDALRADDETTREAALDRHAEQLRARIRELAQKRYFAALERSPEFTVLFLPGDLFLAAALERRPELLEFALERRVQIATPSTLIALLRAVETGWQQARLTEHALEIRDLGTELASRIQVLSGHLATLGDHLGKSAESFNRVVGSFERQVLPAARRFEELGIRARRTESTTPPVSVDVALRKPATTPQTTTSAGDDAAGINDGASNTDPQ